MPLYGLIFFGDSILSGLGASDRHGGCAKLIKDFLPIPVSIRSRNRETSSMALERVSSDVLQSKEHSHVVILFGNNDCWFAENGQSRISQQQFGVNVLKLVELISLNGQVPILCNLQPIDNEKFFAAYPDYIKYRDLHGLDPRDWQKRYSDELEAVALKQGVTLIDIRSSLLDTIEDVMSRDGIHPNNIGHRIIAREILKTLARFDGTMAGHLELP